MSERLSISQLSKSYGATVALSEVNMNIAAGSVHAMLGENGAGKSTLVKILSGIVSPNAGSVSLDGRTIQPHSIEDARREGISTAFQELSLIPYMSVAENLLLPRISTRRLWPDSSRRIRERAVRLLAEWEIEDIPPQTLIADLTLAQRQRVELARAFSHARRLLILDEPTAALPDTRWLFRQIQRVSRQGVSVLYISHRLSEVREICQSATVLRNGMTIASVDLAGIDNDGIFSMMVGYRPGSERGDSRSTAKANASEEPALLETRALNASLLKNLDLELNAGEILGIAALEGQGQNELFRILGGLRKPDSGSIAVEGNIVSLDSPRQALKAGPGIAFVPEERKTEGIFANLSAAANISLPVFSTTGWAKFVNGRIEQRLATASAGQVDLATRYLNFEVGHLSGGNQQKVLLARTLMTQAKILVLFDPTRGVDVGTKHAIYAMMQRFVEQGGAILFYSSELSELVHLSSRCLALYDGRVCAELSAAALSEERLLAAAHGPSSTTSARYVPEAV